MNDLILDETEALDKTADLREAFAKKKKKLPMNIVEFVVGAILLVFCFNYLVDHPSEKSSIVSGVEVLYQKVTIFLSHVTTGRGKLLERKYDMIKGFDELIYMGEDGKCVSDMDLRKLISYHDNLEAMDTSIFEKQQFTYQNLLQTYYQKVLENCDQYELELGVESLKKGANTTGKSESE